MRRLYVVTHPESVHHVTHLVGGWFDSELTDRGLRQAELIAERIRELVPDDAAVELYSSDLTRADQTARVIARKLGVEPSLVEGLREKSYGEADGKAQTWLDERFLPPPPTGDRMNHREGIAGSETKHDFAARVYDAVDAILSSPCSHQLVVTQASRSPSSSPRGSTCRWSPPDTPACAPAAAASRFWNRTTSSATAPW